LPIAIANIVSITAAERTGEVNCLADECVCKAELREAMPAGKGKKMEVKINREIRNYTESMFFGLSSDSSFFLYWLSALRWFCTFVLKPYVGTETVSWMCILGAAPFRGNGLHVNYNGMTAEQFVWAWLRSEMIEPKQIKFEPVNIYYEALKDTIDAHEKEVYKRQ
jgi:hypothetical protein